MAPMDMEPFNVSEVLAGREPMPKGTFIDRVQHLPGQIWPRFVERGQGRMYDRGEELPTGPDDPRVHLVLGGCLSQERTCDGTRVLRFRGRGELLCEGKLIGNGSSGPRTVCMSSAWVMSFSAQEMNRLLARPKHVERELLRSLEDRNRSDERFYCTFKRERRARVALLLLHLAESVGRPVGGGRVCIDGPRQEDLAQALMIGKSSYEEVVNKLQAEGITQNRYRCTVISDRSGLEAAAGTTL